METANQIEAAMSYPKPGHTRHKSLDLTATLMSPPGSQREQKEGAARSQREQREIAAYAGWVYHVGLNSLGYPFCHERFLVIKGKYVSMYKHNPQDQPRAQPLRSGYVGQYLMVEEVGRRNYHGRALYVLRIFSRRDHSRQGEFACQSAEEVEKWILAFNHAKEEAEYEMERATSRRLMKSEDEFKLNGPRHHRSYSRGLNKLITIGGRGSDFLLRRASVISPQAASSENPYFQREGDAVQQADWRCFRTINGLRIFEDVAASKAEKGTIMKSVGVVDAAADRIFELIMSLEKSLRYEWDELTADLELVEEVDGHSDIVYGTFDIKYIKRWHAKRDFVFSRYWRRDQDGSYLIHQGSTTNKSKPAKPGYHRMDFSPGIWEISPLPTQPGTNAPRSLVTQIMEIKSTGWGRWKASHYAKFHNTVPGILLCRIAGLREFFASKPELGLSQAAEPVLISAGSMSGRKTSSSPGSPPDPLAQIPEPSEEFYDAIMVEDPAEEGDSGESEGDDRTSSRKEDSNHVHSLQTLTWSVMMGLPGKRRPGRDENGELVLSEKPVTIDANGFKGTLRRCLNDKGSDCWSEPGGSGFMVRGRTYNDDGLKVPGTDPLLKLMAVDWIHSEDRVDFVAKNPSSIVQSAAGKIAPFIFVVNLQVPAKPNYSMVFYYVADRPLRKGSLLDRFVNGDDAFRNARFKLIPSIVEGYWMVKRAVGTKACLLGKAVTCRYLREDNFLEIDVDIGSSSVARGVIGMVLGYVTSLVVDLAILIEAKEEKELPEYVLGAVRINRIKAESAVPYGTKNAI
ncbi:hypothetical protein R1sor_018969 [Riccia sorocarpa]|uniref:START domain-containing protein n=1 Tax=Riccia sorocarpa TaxID=122646 RepID=A0ABD3IFE7_9MARC